MKCASSCSRSSICTPRVAAASCLMDAPANLKAFLALTTHCVNAVGMRCISHLFNNPGDKIESTQIDRFAGAMHTILSHSHNASQQWRAATKTAPSTSPSHRWASAYERNDLLVKVWQEIKTLVKFSTSDETKSAKAKFFRKELAKKRPDGVLAAAGVCTGCWPRGSPNVRHVLARGGWNAGKCFMPDLPPPCSQFPVVQPSISTAVFVAGLISWP